MNRMMRVLPAALIALSPAALGAQACIGMPQGTGIALVGSVSFPSNATGYTASGVVAASESLYGSASIGVVSPTIDGAENVTVMGADVAYQVPRLLETASVCPTAGVGYSTYGGLSALSIPLGVGVGTTLPLDEAGATTLSPYVTPGLVWSRITVDGLDGSESSTSAALNAGATVGFDRFLAGAFLGKTFRDGSEPIFGVRVGYAF